MQESGEYPLIVAGPTQKKFKVLHVLAKCCINGLMDFFLSEQLCGFYQPHHPSVPAQHSLWWVHAGHPHHLAGRLHRLTSQGLQAHMHSRMLVRARSAVSVFELCIAFIGNVLESIVIVLSTQVWRCSRLSSKWPPMSVKSWTILR